MRWFDQPKGLWHLTVVLCKAVFRLAFVMAWVVPAHAVADQTIYSLQRGTPAAIPNFVDTAAGCNWLGVGGQVFDQAGSPLSGLMIKVSGTLDGRQVLQYVYTGSSQALGAGGYHLKLADRPISSQSLKIQLLDPVGRPLSLPLVFRTYATCQQNLLIINLTPISLENSVYLPQVSR